MWHDCIIFAGKSDLGSIPHLSPHQETLKMLQQQMLTPTTEKISEKSHEVGVR
jgi:hypothetical protein